LYIEYSPEFSPYWWRDSDHFVATFRRSQFRQHCKLEKHNAFTVEISDGPFSAAKDLVTGELLAR
jgi:hypothetical protein